MASKVKVNQPHFQLKISQGACLVQFWAIPAQICEELLQANPNFLWIQSQNGLNNLEGQGQWPLCSIAPRVSHDASWLHLKSVTNYHVDMVNFTYRRPDAGNNIPSAWKANKPNNNLTQKSQSRSVLTNHGIKFMMLHCSTRVNKGQSAHDILGFQYILSWRHSQLLSLFQLK